MGGPVLDDPAKGRCAGLVHGQGGIRAPQIGDDAATGAAAGVRTLQTTDGLIESVEIKDGILTVSPKDESKEARSQHGLMRALINNMVIGVTKGYEKRLGRVPRIFVTGAADGAAVVPA